MREKDLRSLCAKSLQSCLTLCDPMDCRLPGSSVQARVMGSRDLGQFPSSPEALCLFCSVIGGTSVEKFEKHCPEMTLTALWACFCCGNERPRLESARLARWSASLALHRPALKRQEAEL